MGLWPFHAPENHVRWLPDRNGLAFGNNGTVLSAGGVDQALAGSFSVEIWLKARRGWDSGTFLALYSRQQPHQLLLHESVSDLMIQTGGAGEAHDARFYLNDVFGRAPAVFLTVTAKPGELTIFKNGVLARTFPGLDNAAKLRPFQVVIGTAPLGSNSWAGQLYGLAFYNTDLNAAHVESHFRSWIREARPTITPEDHALAVYLFDERTGPVVHNAIRSGVNLTIPKRYVIVDQSFLKPPWREYRDGADSLKDILINIGGFVPLGFCCCACWAQRLQLRRAVIAASLAGVATTLTIEILQAYLPTRQSGVTDLFTNTLGTFIGTGLYAWPPIRALFERILQQVAPRTAA